MRRHFHYACIYACIQISLQRLACSLSSVVVSRWALYDYQRRQAMTERSCQECSIFQPVKRCYLLSLSISSAPLPKQKTDSILKELFIGGKSYSWPVAHSSWPDAILMYATFHLPPTVLCRCHKGCPRLRGGSLPALTCVLSVLCCARCTADSQWRVNHI